jgi:hypothetical protein
MTQDEKIKICEYLSMKPDKSSNKDINKLDLATEWLSVCSKNELNCPKPPSGDLLYMKSKKCLYLTKSGH